MDTGALVHINPETNLVFKKKDENVIELPAFVRRDRRKEELAMLRENKKNISQILTSPQLYMSNTKTGESDILYNVKYTDRNSHFLIQARCGFGQITRIMIKYNEFEYDCQNRAILTIENSLANRGLIKRTPYMLCNCSETVELQKVYGASASHPLMMKCISNNYYNIPKFAAGQIRQYEKAFTLYDDTNIRNHVSNILLISHISTDIYILQLIDYNGMVNHSEVLRAAEQGIIVINDKETFSLRIVPFAN